MNALLEELDERQYEDLYHVDDAPIADVRQKALSRFGWWAVVFTVAGVVTSFTVKIPDMIQTAFVLKSEVAEEIYRFPSAVYVEKLHIQNGQSIKAGTPMLELSAPDISALANEVVIAQDNLRAFRDFKTVSAQAERSIQEVAIQKIEQEIALKTAQLTSLEAKWRSESTKLTAETAEASQLLDQMKGLYKSGDVSKNDLNQAEVSHVRSQNAKEVAAQTYQSDHTTLTKQIASLQLEIKSLKKQITKNQADVSLEGERLRSSVNASEKRINGSFGDFDVTANNHLLLKAPKDGTVSFVFNGDKEVPAGTILAKLIYKDAPLYAHIQVSSSQIGKIKIGQSVVMKLDAYPVYEWGAVKGQVSNVSLTPDENGQFTITANVTDYHHLRKLMRIGMKGSGNIIFEDETLAGYVFRKFRKVTSELTD
ncbi:HlyD family secretion protein [Spirosoma gilvum]